MILACVAPSPDNLELAQRARRFVQTNLFDPDLGTERLQRELGMSRSRLRPAGSRAISSTGACSMPTPHLPMPATIVALSTLRSSAVSTTRQNSSRAFKREFGYSPGDVRAGAKDWPPSRPDIELQKLPQANDWAC
jgi:AraC-like DNA-binding protein